MKRNFKLHEKDIERKNSSLNENSNSSFKRKLTIRKSRYNNNNNFNKKRVKKTEGKAEND